MKLWAGHPRLAAVALGLLLPLSRAPDDGRCADAADSFLESHLLVTWYGNPHSAAMGVLGQGSGAERADRLRSQAAAYEPLTSKSVVAAYHVVAVVAQRKAGADGKWSRRESPVVIRALLEEARGEGFMLVLDVQPGRSRIEEELEYLRPFLSEPDVHLPLDPEFGIRDSLSVDVVLDMDGFGGQSLKLATYAAIRRQRRLEFSGVKLFYKQDVELLSPAQVMGLEPVPAVVIYQ
jgi:hypothetical protein